MKVLLTGASGFLGRRVLEHVIRAGHEAIVVQRRTAIPNSEAAHTIIHDLTNELHPSYLPSDLDAVCHMAATVNLAGSIAGFEACWQNIVTTLNVAKIILRKSVSRVVFTSSASVYRRPPKVLPVKEDAECEPSSAYALSKMAGEWMLKADNFSQAGVSSLILRCSSIYGAGQKGESVLPTFVNRVRAGQQPIVHGSGSRSQDFVNVEDVAIAHLKAIEVSLSSGVHIFNIGSGEETSLISLAESVLSVFDDSKRLRVQIERARLAEVEHRFWMDIGKAKSVLGFSPRSILDGLKALRAALDGH